VRKRAAIAGVCLLGLILMAILLAGKPAEIDDFLPFYRAARLLGDPDLFAQTRFHAGGLMFLRTPFYALLLAPLAALPYPAARALWIGLMAAALASAVWLWPGPRAKIAIAMCWGAPVLLALAQVQDIGFMLLVVAVTARLWMSGRELPAGVIASLLALKITLLPAVALVFVARSRRGTYGLAAGLAFHFLVSLAMQGPSWFPEYLAAVRSPLLDQVPRRMPTLRALLPPVPFAAAAVLVYAGLWRFARRGEIPVVLTAALPLAMIAAPHAYAYDVVVAVPLFAAALARHTVATILATIALSPIPYALLSMDHPSPFGVELIIGAVLAGVWAVSREARSPALSSERAGPALSALR